MIRAKPKSLKTYVTMEHFVTIVYSADICWLRQIDQWKTIILPLRFILIILNKNNMLYIKIKKFIY